MPEECASIRSMARCVLPVLVGPSTAVTPAPRAREIRFGCGRKRDRHYASGLAAGPGRRPAEGFLYHNATDSASRRG